MPVPLSAAERESLEGVRNPFRGSIVGDPWRIADDAADVDRIHHAVFQRCCEAVDHARSGVGIGGIIISGEPGSGKTHLVGRLRKRLTDDLKHPTTDRPRQAFACVRLDTSACSVARHVRRKVAEDLLRSVGGPNQFERLVITRLMEVDGGQGHLAPWWEHFRDHRLETAKDLLTDLALRDGLSAAFVEVLCHLVARRHRLDVAAWLRGDPLTPEAPGRLGIAAEDPEENPEGLARRHLVDMMRLAGSSMPLVLCFDQVEALQTSPDDVTSLFAFGQLLSQLQAADPNLVLISCMQSSLHEMIRGQLPQNQLDRIGGFAALTLNPLKEEEAALLLACRLRSAGVAGISPETAADIWPFCAADVRQFVGKLGCPPRRLLDQAARRFDELAGRAIESSTLPPRDRMSDEWENRLDSATQQNDPGRSVAILRSGLQHLIHVTNSGWRTEADPSDSLDFVLVAPGAEARVGVKVCDDSPQRLASQLKKLTNAFPARLGLHKLVLLKDQRRPISPKAVKTLEYLKTLQTQDAVYHQVCPEAFAALDAVCQLLADAKSGDLDFDGTTVPASTVIDWLRSHLPSSLTDLAEILMTQSAGSDEWGFSLIDRLQDRLNEDRIGRVADIAESLATQPDDLIAAATSRMDLFRVLDGAEAVVFSVRHGGPGRKELAH